VRHKDEAAIHVRPAEALDGEVAPGMPQARDLRLSQRIFNRAGYLRRERQCFNAFPLRRSGRARER
jgi:hypothetical protein